MAEENHYFIGLSDPTAVRKELLLCSKDIIMGLKNVELIKDLTFQRAREVEFLKKTMAELKSVMKALKKALPKTNMNRFPIKKSTQTVLAKPSRRGTRPESRRASSKLDKLEAEIAKIESKLEELE